jgi:quercetin dioxygenase-like cupin family protein
MQTKYRNVASDRCEGAPTQPFAVNIEQSPIEGSGDAQSGILTWRTLISGDRTPSDELTIGIADFPPHGRLNLHRHAPAEFYFGLAGEGTVTANGVPLAIAKGVAVFIPGNTEHGVVAGAGGLSVIYGFAQRAFSSIVYDYREHSPPQNTTAPLS